MRQLKLLRMSKVTPYKSSESKKEQIKSMFDNIAKNYDFLNHSLSLGMDNLWRKIAIKNIKNNPKKILDIATGTADFAISSAKHTNAKIIGVDISQGMLDVGEIKIKKKKLSSRISLQNTDCEDLPFKENSFDFILCNHVLEHINDDKKAIKELYRVLNKNGTAILQVPINQKSSKTFEDSSIVDKKERIEKFGQYDHIRLYGLDYFKKLESFGFKVYPLKYSKEFTESEIIKYGLIKDEIIPVCKKG